MVDCVVFDDFVVITAIVAVYVGVGFDVFVSFRIMPVMLSFVLSLTCCF